MNTFSKITGICIILFVFSIPAYALVASNSEAGKPVIFTPAATGTTLPALSFNPSGNTLISAVSAEGTYDICSTSSKTDATNGLVFGMDETFNGYYQKAGGKTIPTGFAEFSGWTKMGGGS